MSLEFPKNNIIDDWLEKNKPMITDINKKNSTINMILCFVLGVVLALTVKSCVDKPQPAIVTKGSFKPVKVPASETKAIPGTNQIVDANKKVDTLEAFRFKNLYNLTQKEYDSLLVQYAKLDSLKNATNDKYYQDLYEKCKPIEFTKTWKSDDSSFTATLSGISNGAPERLLLDWKYKAPPPKQTVFALWGGVEAGITSSLKKFNAKVNLDFQIGESTMIKSSFDTDQRIYLGVSKSFLDIKR